MMGHHSGMHIDVEEDHMASDTHDVSRDQFMLSGSLADQGYDWWWHSLTAYNKETGEEKPFFIEYYTCNPALAEDEPTLGQDPVNKANGKWPSYFMMKCGTWYD